MDERVMQFRVGVMVVFALLATALLLIMFGKLPDYMPGHSYTIYIKFNYAAGVMEGTPVRKSGILIGRVTNVQLTDDDQKVLVTASIDGDKHLYTNEECFVSRDLLGDSALAFIANPQKNHNVEPLAPNSTIVGEVSNDPTGLKSMLAQPINTVTETGRALTEASRQLEAAAKRVEDILSPKAQDDIHEILSDAAKSLKTIQAMLGDEENRNSMAEAIKRLPNTLDSMNRTFQATDEMLSAFTARSKIDGRTPVERMVETVEMAEKTLRRFTESTDPTRPPPADQVARAMENIGEITTLMRTIMSRIERGEGSLGALLRDRQLYDRLNCAAKNIERISLELRPIVHDARVFSDKVSRHPGVIIRDAIKPGVGVK